MSVKSSTKQCFQFDFELIHEEMYLLLLQSVPEFGGTDDAARTDSSGSAL